MLEFGIRKAPPSDHAGASAVIKKEWKDSVIDPDKLKKKQAGEKRHAGEGRWEDGTPTHEVQRPGGAGTLDMA